MLTPKIGVGSIFRNPNPALTSLAMEIEEDEDAYLTAIDYSYDYLLEGLTDNEQSPSPSQLFSLDDVDNLLKCKKEHDLFALHLNAVSLVSNFLPLSLRHHSLQNKLCTLD